MGAVERSWPGCVDWEVIPSRESDQNEGENDLNGRAGQEEEDDDGKVMDPLLSVAVCPLSRDSP